MKKLLVMTLLIVGLATVAGQARVTQGPPPPPCPTCGPGH
jgi:hypothetical protein